MKFVHFTDTHLGKNEAKLEEREKDFYRAFRQAIDFSIEKKVDFVIHTGDIFDRARPAVRTLVFTVEQLSRLKKAGIPCYTIVGSHDIGVEDTIVSVLESVGLLVNLNSARYYKSENGKIKVGGEFAGDCFLCGIAGKRARIKEIYESLEVDLKGKFNIFMFHHIVSDISEKFADIPSSVLPQGFDYYAAGHWHSFAEFRQGSGVIVYPGSTEYNDLFEMEKDTDKYFIYAETEPFKYEKIKINTRDIVSKNFNCTGLDAKDVASKVISGIQHTDKN
ncbi:MAG TPA: DNA repair exonuclease, partial [Candidatus Woesearchaeota archaeon]|nr:DNA repair exonuclease [Candidatus Woesearchaeota archaeon]